MATKTHSLNEINQLKAADVMSSPVVTVHVWDSIRQVAGLFVEKNISCAAVVDMNDVPLGVITKSDIARYESQRESNVQGEQLKHPKTRDGERIENRLSLVPEEVTIESWITPAVFEVDPFAPIATVAKMMVKNGTHHLLVTDPATKKVRGVVTSFDLLVVMNRFLNS